MTNWQNISGNFWVLLDKIGKRLIKFQGRLTDQQGNPLEGTYNLKFSLYPSPDPTASPLWTEEHDNVNASKGIVNVLLGSIQSFDEPVKVTFDQERYLGITIDCDHDSNTKEPEMSPRQRILPAIFAYTAGIAHNADIAGNADKLDGKDSSEFTTPEKDANNVSVLSWGISFKPPGAKCGDPFKEYPSYTSTEVNYGTAYLCCQ